jgi:hypothetical protein
MLCFCAFAFAPFLRKESVCRELGLMKQSQFHVRIDLNESLPKQGGRSQVDGKVCIPNCPRTVKSCLVTSLVDGWEEPTLVEMSYVVADCRVLVVTAAFLRLTTCNSEREHSADQVGLLVRAVGRGSVIETLLFAGIRSVFVLSSTVLRSRPRDSDRLSYTRASDTVA